MNSFKLPILIGVASLAIGITIGVTMDLKIQHARVESATSLDPVTVEKLVSSYDNLTKYEILQSSMRRNCSYDEPCHKEWKRVQAKTIKLNSLKLVVLK